MIFFHVIQNISPGVVQFVESTIAGFCIFTKFESRAKLFTKDEADELVLFLRTKKIKNHYAKIQTQIPNDDAEIRFRPPGNEASDKRSDPFREKRTGDRPEGTDSL